MTTKFEYLLNAMENAAAQDSPSAHGYAGKRQMVLQYVADLEARVEYPSSPQVAPLCVCGHYEAIHIVIIDNRGTESVFCYACPDTCSEFRAEVKPRTGDKS